MIEDKFEIYGNCVRSPSGKTAQLMYPISEVLEFGSVVVVVLHVPGGQIMNENVFGVNSMGEIVWQISSRKYCCLHNYCPYLNMLRIGEVVRLCGGDGILVDTDPITGTIIRTELGK